MIEGFGIGGELLGCLGSRFEVFLNFRGFSENIQSLRIVWNAASVEGGGAKDMSVLML